MSVLSAWVGSGGKPVANELAQARANVCAGTNPDGSDKCPLNGHGEWWQSAVGDIADVIRQILEFKNRMRISVSNEDKLFMCSACGCCARLKVHTPLDHILKNSSPETMAKLDPRCWILKEQVKS